MLQKESLIQPKQNLKTSSVSLNILIETEQPKERRIPPVRARQPTLGIGEIKDLMVMVVGTQMEMEVPMDMVVTHMEIVDQMGMETPQ